VQAFGSEQPRAPSDSLDSRCVVGTADGDMLSAGAAGDVILAGLGDDTITGGPGGDTLVGDDGRDRIEGRGGRDQIDGGYGNDVIQAGAGSDLILGGPGQDTLRGEGGDDVIDGGSGDDTAAGGSGDDRIYGRLGDDRIVGGAGTDRLWGDTGCDDLRGDAGDDTLVGGAGDDTMEGGEGSDRLFPGMGIDLARGGAGDDRIYIQHLCELASGETIDGGPGVDTVISQVPRAAVESAGVVLISIEKFTLDPSAARDVCKTQDPARERIEVTGVPVSSESLWLDADGNVTGPEYAGSNYVGNLSTRFEFRVDAAYAGESLVHVPATVFVYQPGGRISVGSRGIVSEPCCSPRIRLQERVRLTLRRLQTSEPENAYEVEGYAPYLAEPSTSLLRLGDHGSIAIGVPAVTSYDP